MLDWVKVHVESCDVNVAVHQDTQHFLGGIVLNRVILEVQVSELVL